MVNQAGSSKRNQPRAATRKSYSVRGGSGATNRSAKSSDKPKFNPNSAKSSTSSSSSSRYKKSRDDADRQSSLRKSSNTRSKPRQSVDSKSLDSANRSDRSDRDRRSPANSSTRKPFEKNQSANRRTDSAARTDRSSSERGYSDRAKPRSSAGRSDRTGSIKPSSRDTKSSERSGRPEFRRESKPGERGGSRSNSDRPRREGIGKPKSSSDRERGGRDRGQERPQRFDTPRRFRGDLPRRERDQRARGNAPIIDDDITGDELGEELSNELRSLPTGLTITVAQHLVMTQRYLEINPELALVHAKHAKELAGRFPTVREIVGVTFYVNGLWQEALNDFRAVKRMANADHLIAMMADCERGLGRPEKAIAFLAEHRSLSGVDRIEAAIVEAGARSDLAQHEAALLALKIPALAGYPADQTAYARLCFTYAEILRRLNREDEALIWFKKADKADPAATAAAEFLTDAQEEIYLEDLDADPENQR